MSHRVMFLYYTVLPCRNVPLNLVNEDLTLGEDLRQLLLELPVLLVIRQRLNRSGAQRGGEVTEVLEISCEEDGSDKRSRSERKRERERERSIHADPADCTCCKGQTNNYVLPKAVDNVLSFSKVDFIEGGANLVLHILKAKCRLVSIVQASVCQRLISQTTKTHPEVCFIASYGQGN